MRPRPGRATWRGPARRRSRPLWRRRYRLRPWAAEPIGELHPIGLEAWRVGVGDIVRGDVHRALGGDKAGGGNTGDQVHGARFAVRSWQAHLTASRMPRAGARKTANAAGGAGGRPASPAGWWPLLPGIWVAAAADACPQTQTLAGRWRKTGRRGRGTFASARTLVSRAKGSLTAACQLVPHRGRRGWRPRGDGSGRTGGKQSGGKRSAGGTTEATGTEPVVEVKPG